MSNVKQSEKLILKIQEPSFLYPIGRISSASIADMQIMRLGAKTITIQIA